MACFLVPTAEAIVTTIVKKATHHKNEDGKVVCKSENPFLKKMNWLNNMLWGGSALLALEHVWHGEVTPWFPFLTNAASPDDAAEMLFEISTSGVAMAAAVTAAWVGMVLVSRVIEKRKQPENLQADGGAAV